MYQLSFFPNLFRTIHEKILDTLTSGQCCSNHTKEEIVNNIDRKEHHT